MGRKRGGGGGTQQVIQKNEPWAQQRPYLQDVFSAAQQQYRAPGPSFFPGKTYAEFSPETEESLRGIAARARAGSPAQQAAEQNIASTLRGDYLYGGPAFNRALEAAQAQIIPSIESRFARSGRFGSGLARAAEAKALGDVFAGQYGQERMAQQRAAMLAPQIAQAGYQDLARLQQVGQQREALEQEKIDEAIRRYQFEQEKPQQKLGQYAGLVSGSGYGGESVQQTSPFAGSRAAGILGGALGGAGLISQLGGSLGPIGLPGGAILGGLLGGLF